MSDRNDRVLMHSFETGRGRRIAILVAALFLVAVVIWVVALGFHGQHFRSNAAALTHPFETPTQPVR